MGLIPADVRQRNSGDSRSVEHFTLEVAQEFHRRMAGAIEAVQAGIWQAGGRELLGYATDFGFGRGAGIQTLALKTSRKSAYLRLHWDTILGASEADQQLVKDAIRSAITELS